MDQLAQVPDAVVSKTADTFLNLGIAGAVIIVLLGFGFFVLRALLGCLNSSIERQAALVTVVKDQEAAGEKAATALDGLSQRVISMERTIELKMVPK